MTEPLLELLSSNSVYVQVLRQTGLDVQGLCQDPGLLYEGHQLVVAGPQVPEWSN